MTRTRIVLGLVAAGTFICGCEGAVPDDIAELEQAVTCNPAVKVYPVRAPHNHGYDSAAGNSSLWTCNDDRSNSDYYFNSASNKHLGNDVWAAGGAPVASSTDGVVTTSGYSSPGPGWRVVVRDPCGWHHFYYHLQSIEAGINVNTQVKAGQLIGKVGASGTTSNGVIHLHYTLSKTATWQNDPSIMIDPHPYLRAVEKNVCGPATPPPPPPPPPVPVGTRAMRRRVASDKATVCGRATDGIHCVIDDGQGFNTKVSGPTWRDSDGWDQERYAATIQLADVNGDGRADVCGRASDHVYCYLSDGLGFPTKVTGPAWTDTGGWGAVRYYSTIQFADINGDGKADVCARASDNVYCYLSDGMGFPTKVTGPAWSDGAGWGDAKYYSTVQFGDVNGDGKADVCARDRDTFHCYLSDGMGFPTRVTGPGWSDASGWGEERYFSTIQLADVNGDGKADVCGRASDRVHCYLSDGMGFASHVTGPAWSNANGWGEAKYFSTLQFADVDGDGKADVCGRAGDGVQCYLSDGNGFPTQVIGPAWSDANGWGDPKHFSTIQLNDINGDGKADVCGRATDNVYCYLSDGAGFPTKVTGPAWSDASGWGDPKHYATLRYLAAAVPNQEPPPTTGAPDLGAGGAPDMGSTGDPGDGDGVPQQPGGCSVAGSPATGAGLVMLLVVYGLVLRGAIGRSRRPWRRAPAGRRCSR
jgi:hypothetical protein